MKCMTHKNLNLNFDNLDIPIDLELILDKALYDHSGFCAILFRIISLCAHKTFSLSGFQVVTVFNMIYLNFNELFH